MTMITTNGGVNPWRLLGWLFDVLGGLCLAFCVWIAGQVIQINQWRAETQGNRWSSAHQVHFAETQAKEHTELWKEMVAMRAEWLKQVSELNVKLARMPDQYPPKWFEDWARTTVKDLDDRIKGLEQRKVQP